MADPNYVHGYSARESTRLADQASTLSELLHHDTAYAAGDRVLECGCGTGAQTVLLAANSPEARIVSVDVSVESLGLARRRVEEAGGRNVVFGVADVYRPPFENENFDHVFVCFVLEHLSNPVEALVALKRVLRPGGSLTVIEGDHGSWYCYPQTPAASRAVECLIEIQARAGGDALIGRRLHPLLVEAGYRKVQVSPRMVYVDSSRPHLVEGFSKNTFIAMVEGVRDAAISAGLVDADVWEQGIADLYRATAVDGTFCYTFFKATAVK
ncbi:MAG: methyltransferase domain-containing protein [Acidobacteriales bacterium]|nr:methyltransferase domain-containing protein [Terriglobales bacterium]